MSGTLIDQEYENLVSRSRSNGLTIPGKDERRQAPRLKVEAPELWSDGVPLVSVVDMSRTGIAILSNYSANPGERFTVSLGDSISGDAEVLRCVLDESASVYLDGQFRIHLRFRDLRKGKELFVRSIKSAQSVKAMAGVQGETGAIRHS